MSMDVKDIKAQYPHLFNRATWGNSHVRFTLLDDAPADTLIGNVNIVSRSGSNWVILQLEDGSWEIPGGTLESGEKYLDTARRELMEEAGAELLSASVIGAWDCLSMASKPYRPHLPHPHYYRLVLCGDVRIVGAPLRLPGAEKIAAVDVCSLKIIIERFSSLGREDLAELYELASWICS